MNTKIKSRIWAGLAIMLIVLSAFFFLTPLLFAMDFVRPGAGFTQWAQFILVIAFIPIILFSFGMICRIKAKDHGTANQAAQSPPE